MAKAGVKNLTASTEDILNAIRGQASLDYQNRVPVATQNNIAEVGNAITSYGNTMNEFLEALVNRIGLVVIQSKMYSNPLKEFKKGMLEFGKDIEEVFINIAHAQTYNPTKAESEVFKQEIPDVRAIFHRVNRQDFYKVTTREDQLRQAFLSYEGVSDLITGIVNSMYAGDEYDEFLLMKQLLVDYSPNYYRVKVPAITDEASGKAAVKLFRQYANDLTFMSAKYNKQNVATHTPKDDQIIIINTATDAAMDVDVLSAAFNMDRAQFLSRRIIVDNLEGLTGFVAILCDKSFFMVYDTNIRTESIYNPQGLYWNNFFHHWEILSTSQFANAILFTTEDVAESGVTSVSVNPTTATAAKGTKVNISAIVETVGAVDNTVEWSLTGNNSESTHLIAGTGSVWISTDETATTLTVTATSLVDSTKSASATITIS